MPAHNASATVEAAIRSVMLQTVEDFELIVSDDGSTDDTPARARRFDDPRVRLLTRDRAGGPSAARNAAIAVAHGEFVSMIDSDDLWLPSYLEVMGQALEDDPDAGLAYTDAWVLDDETGRIRQKTAMAYQRPPEVPPADPRRFVRLLVDDNFVFSHATVRRSVLEQVGDYDERLGWGEDFELWLRILEAGYKAVRKAGPLAIYRRHSRSRTADLGRAYEGMCQTYTVILSEHALDDEARAIAHARYEWWLKQRDTFVHPSPLEHLLRVARPIKNRLLDRTLWREEPPTDVAATLVACQEGGARSDHARPLSREL
jgi:glycosyltransferase involved in cell wall biosynthesis